MQRFWDSPIFRVAQRFVSQILILHLLLQLADLSFQHPQRLAPAATELYAAIHARNLVDIPRFECLAVGSALASHPDQVGQESQNPEQKFCPFGQRIG